MNFLAAALETDIGKFLGDLPKASAGFWDLGLNALLNNLAQTFLVVAVAVATFVLIFGGIKWATAGGDKEALGSAQKMITSAIIGLVIVFSAWAIINLVKNFFGIGGGTTGGGSSAYVCPGLGGINCKAGTYSPGPCEKTGGENCCLCQSSGLWKPATVNAGQCQVKSGNCQ